MSHRVQELALPARLARCQGGQERARQVPKEEQERLARFQEEEQEGCGDPLTRWALPGAPVTASLWAWHGSGSGCPLPGPHAPSLSCVLPCPPFAWQLPEDASQCSAARDGFDMEAVPPVPPGVVRLGADGGYCIKRLRDSLCYFR